MPKLLKHDPKKEMPKDERERLLALRDPLLRRDQDWVDNYIDTQVRTMDDVRAVLKKLTRAVRALEDRKRGR